MLRHKLTPNDRRGQLLGFVGSLRHNRTLMKKPKTFNDAYVKDQAENYREYRKKVVDTTDRFRIATNPEVHGKLNQRVVAAMQEIDSSIEHYDSTQDKWWVGTKDGKEFIDTVRLLAIHKLHGGLDGPQDAFHTFQMFKFAYEEDQEKRSAEDFVQPGYGGLYLPKEYTERLLKNLTKNKNLPVLEGKERLVLSLDWWPEVGEKGKEELVQVAEAAKEMGYWKVEFLMENQKEHKEMAMHFGGAFKTDMETRGGKQVCVGKLTIDHQEDDGAIANPLQQVEFREIMIKDIPEDHFRNNKNMLQLQGSSTLIASACDSVGFSYRILVSAEREDGEITSLGFFAPRADDKMLHDIVDALKNPLLQRFDYEALQGKVLEIWTKINSAFAYFVSIDKYGDEKDFEVYADHPKWKHG